MKKTNLLKLSFWAMVLFAGVAFTSCVDDNADDGMPYLEVTPDRLEFTTAGEPVGTSTVTVKTNRPWELSMDSSVDWVTASATSGSGDAAVEFVVPASTIGRSATMSFSLKNSYGAYITRDVAIEQGEIGAVTRLLGYIKSTWPTDPSAAVALGYSIPTIEAVILANNAGGNNRGKLYVGDNVMQPGSAIIIYNLDYNNTANYPVGKKVTLDLSQAKFSPFNKLRQLIDVGVTVSADPAVTLNIPSLNVAQFNSGNYQGQYVKINDVTPAPAPATVDKPWAGVDNQTLNFTSASATLAVYMRKAADATAFAGFIVKNATGAIYGVAEQFSTTVQLLPTDPEDIRAFIDATPKVTTLDATNVDRTIATFNGSLSFIDNTTEVGFEYMDYAATPVWTGAQKVTATLTDGKWSANVTGLTQGKKYSFRAYAKTASDTYYGDMKSVTPDVGPLVSVDFTVATNYPSDFPVESKNKKVDPTEYTFGGQKFTFAGSTGEGFYTPGKAYVMWGKKDAYILLPAIAGKSLAQVRCTVPTDASGSLQVGVFENNGTATVQGGNAITWTKDGFTAERTYIYDVASTAANTAYRLQVASAHNAQLAKLELWYNDGATPGKPEITVAPASVAFGAAADNTGKTVAITTTNDDGLTLFAESTDATQFPMTLVGKTLTVTALANADETNSKTATVTVYLAASKDGERKATATVAVSQSPKTPKTVAELVTYLNSTDVNPAFNAQKVLTDWNGMVITGYIAGNNSGSNLGKMLAVVDNNASAAGAGVILYDDAYNTVADYPIGAKIQITIGADSYCKNNYGMLRLEKVTATVDKATTVTITPLSVTAAQFNAGNYVGMSVKIAGLKYKEMEPQKWNTGSATSTSSQIFVAGADEAIVRTYGGCSWAGDYISAVKTNGSITGIGQVYMGSATGTPAMQLNPIVAANVADFAITMPMIVDANPSSVVLAGAGGSQVVTLAILNQGSNALSVSGLSAPFTTSVSGLTVTVTAPANATGAAIPGQTLTVSLAGGNSITIPVSQLVPGAKEYDMISTVAALSAGDYFVGGYAKTADILQLFTGAFASSHGVTSIYTYNEATGALTTEGNAAVVVTLEAVTPTVNAYRIKVDGKYLIATAAASGKLSLVAAGAAGADNYWNFTDNTGGGIKALQSGTAENAQMLISNATDANVLRSGSSSTAGNGLRFFKKN